MRRLALLIAVLWAVIACEPEAEGYTLTTCELDGGHETVCTSPVTYAGLAPGTHTVVVRAKNFYKDGGVWVWSEESSDTRTWVVAP